MVYKGQFILTESEIALDGADALRFGRDIFVTLSHVRNFNVAFLFSLLATLN